MEKQNSQDVSLLVMSCDAYEDCWKPFFTLLDKYWKDCRFERFIATETKDCQYAKALKHSGSWTKRMRESLKEINTPFVMIMCEDFFIRSKVDSKTIEKSIDLFDGNTATVSFETAYDVTTPSDWERYGVKPNKGKYLRSCQPSIWDRKKLIELMSGDMNAQQWEMSVTDSPYKFYVNTGKPIINIGHRDENGKHRIYGVHKGQWVRKDVVELFAKEKISVDFNKLGFTDKIKLSIIIPAYNVEPYVAQCLYSLFPQLTDMVEVFIIDDASTDETVPTIEKVMSNFKGANITLIKSKENKGVSHARNLGLEKASGEYIAFIDADDKVEKLYIQSILIAIKSGCDYYKMSWASFGADVVLHNAQHVTNPAVWCRVYKRRIITVPFDTSYVWGEDGKFNRDNLNPKMRVGYIMRLLYRYRRHSSGSLSTSKLQKIRL